MPVRFLTLKLDTLPNAEEWLCLDIFRERAGKAMAILSKVKPGRRNHHVARLPDGRMKFEGDIPKSDVLDLLYFEFRHLYAQEERGSLRRNLNIIGRCCEDPRMRACLRSLKEDSRSSFVRTMVSLGTAVPNAVTATSEQVVDAMVNGYIFHSDLERRRQVDELVAKFTRTGVDVLLFYAVWDFVLAAKNFGVLIRATAPENPFVLLPEKFALG